MQVENGTGSYPAMETLMKGFSNGAPSFIDKAGSYIKENVKPKFEFKENPDLVSGFFAPLGVAGVQGAKNLAAKKGVLPILTTAKPYTMSEASVPMNVVNLAKGYTAGKGILAPNEIYANKGQALNQVMDSLSNSVVTGTPNSNPGTLNFGLGKSEVPLNVDKIANAASPAAASANAGEIANAASTAAPAAQGGISWHDITTAGAGALGLVGAVALTKAAKAGVKKVKRAHALMKADKQVERERNSARLKVLEDSGLADPSDRKRALALPPASYGAGEFSILDSVIKAGKAAASSVSNLAKGNSASIKGLEGLAKSAGEARSSLFSGKSQTYGLKDKILSKIHIGDIGSDSRSKIVTSQAQNLEKGGGSVADFFDKRAQRGMNKVNSLTEQLKKATSDEEKTQLNDMISRQTAKVQRNLGRKEIISDSTKALSDLAKENPKLVLGAESAVKSVAKTSQMNARARASEAEAQRLNAQSK